MISPLRLPQKLRIRLTLLYSVVFFIAASVLVVTLARQSADAVLRSEFQSNENLLRMLAPAISRGVENQNIAALSDDLRGLATNHTVDRIRVADETGLSLYIYGSDVPAPAWITRMLASDMLRPSVIKMDIEASGQVLGAIEVTLSSNIVDRQIHRMVITGSLVALLLWIITAAGVFRLGARLTAPLTALTLWAREFPRGSWKAKVRLSDSPVREIQELNQAYRDGSTIMLHNIRSLEETRELLEHSENRLRKLINGMHEILFELDTDGSIRFLNPAWESLTGYSAKDSLEKPFTDFLLDQDVINDFSPERLHSLHEKGREIGVRSAGGKLLWMSLETSAQSDSSGNFTGVIGTMGDVTKSVELNRQLNGYQDELYHMSVTDPLTGLYNRRHFDTQLEVILSDHLSKNQSVCLLLIDLDGFKFINDTYGHPFGDEVLRTTAFLLRAQVRRNDYIARLAGDEFAMVLKNTGLEDATRIAQKLHVKIHETRIPLPVGHMQLQSSIGVAEAPTHGKIAQDLVSAADVALYHSKRRGRNRIEVLSPDSSKAVMSIFSQGFELRNALEQGNIHPAYQPIFDLSSGKPMAYEVLARMSINNVVIKAQDFITLAEELGLTREVDLHIIRTALNHTSRTQALFLNVDLSSFGDKAFVQNLVDVLKPECDAGRSITIEITERESIAPTDTLLDDLQALRKLGCKLALDDFGSGYSTYNFLNRFRPDYLKIEGSFVRGMLTNDSDRKIVEHIHELATSFGMQTIAESVEDQATQHALVEMGIEAAQGIFFGAPQFFERSEIRIA